MLTKPISLSPDSESISIENNTITFSARFHNGCTFDTYIGEDGVEYCNASLILQVNGKEYTYRCANTKVERLSQTIKVFIDLNINSEYVMTYRAFRSYETTEYKGAFGFRVEKKQEGIYTQNVRPSDFLNPGYTCSWKIRLFDKINSEIIESYSPTSIVAYGSVSGMSFSQAQEWDTIKGKYVDLDYSENILQITPHVNIYDDVLGQLGEDLPSDPQKTNYPYELRYPKGTDAQEIQKSYIISTTYNIVENYDPRLKYFIIINGRKLPIKYYRLFEPHGENDKIYIYNSDAITQMQKYFDNYGNPLYGYAILEESNDLSEVIGEGDTYQIRCNYIESSNAFFEINTEPTISVKRGDVSLDTCTHENPYELNFYPLNLDVMYSQNEGIELNYFNYKIYRYNSLTLSYELEFSSGNLYNQDLNISYNDFQNNQKYKIVITLVDGVQRVYERELFLYTSFYPLTINTPVSLATVEYYHEHNSVIIDWTDAFSDIVDALTSATKSYMANLNVTWTDEECKDYLLNSYITGFKVYKTLGDSNKLYEVANIAGTAYTILEDFAVGDNCKYKYYIYPQIAKSTAAVGNWYEIFTQEITLKEGVNKVFGLKKLEDKVYEVDTSWVWRLYLNLSDTGYTINNDKTFYDTLSRYNQEYVGNRKYITKSISSLIGSIDCSTGAEYIDTYDMLVSWNEFVTSPSLKCLIDSRGLILPGNFEANPSVEYLDSSESQATAKFNWRQKSDLDIIKIYGTLLPFNPLRNEYLFTLDGKSLESEDSNILYGEGQEG